MKLEVVAKELFNKIRGRFSSVTIGDNQGNITSVPENARYFDFDFENGGFKLGKISVSLSEDEGVVIIFNKDFVENSVGDTKDVWYDFLKDLRVFSKKRLLPFEVRDINKTNLDKRDYAFMSQNRSGEVTMRESKLYGTNKTSFQKIGNAKLAIKHSQTLEDNASRTQKIGKIFIENADGEKFRYPFKHLSGARAMARHVSEGGNPYDDFGKHILGLSEELSNLVKFKQYMGRSKVMAEGLSKYMTTVTERIADVKKTIQNLQKESYYKSVAEDFVPIEETEVPEDVTENWIDELTIKQFNEELKDVFPYIYKLVSESSIAEGIDFEDIMSEEKDTIVTVLSTDKGIMDILRRHGVPANELKSKVADTIEINGLDDKGTIFPGQQLRIPVVIDPASRDERPVYQSPDGTTSRSIPQGMTDSVETAIDSLMGQFAEEISEGYMKGYQNYHCKDCGCQMHNCKPDCDCPHDSNDESGAWWRDANGNGVPDMLESVVTEKAGYCSDKCCGSDVKAEDCKCSPTCAHCDCNAVNEKTVPGGQQAWNARYQKHETALQQINSLYKKENTQPFVSALRKLLMSDDDFRDWYTSSKTSSHVLDKTMDLVNSLGEGNAFAKAVRMAKMNGAKKGDEVDGPDGEKITIEKDQKTPLGEFILSYFDKETGKFPKGETAVLTMVEKDYGDEYVKKASQFIERLGHAFEQYKIRKNAGMYEGTFDDFGLKDYGSELDKDSDDEGFAQKPMYDQLGKVIDSAGNPKPVDTVTTDDGKTFKVKPEQARMLRMMATAEQVKPITRSKFIKDIQTSAGLKDFLDIDYHAMPKFFMTRYLG
jgi:hypothetical protein